MKNKLIIVTVLIMTVLPLIGAGGSKAYAQSGGGAGATGQYTVIHLGYDMSWFGGKTYKDNIAAAGVDNYVGPNFMVGYGMLNLNPNNFMFGLHQIFSFGTIGGNGDNIDLFEKRGWSMDTYFLLGYYKPMNSVTWTLGVGPILGFDFVTKSYYNDSQIIYSDTSALYYLINLGIAAELGAQIKISNTMVAGLDLNYRPTLVSFPIDGVLIPLEDLSSNNFGISLYLGFGGPRNASAIRTKAANDSQQPPTSIR